MLGDICRVCLANNINGFDIFNNYKGDYNLREIIYELSLVEISPCNSLPRTVCQMCADKLVDFHIFSVMLLDSQNELLAAEEAININLPEVAKFTNSSNDDDNFEIDETVLDLFNRLHEHDPPEHFVKETLSKRDMPNGFALEHTMQELSIHFNRIDILNGGAPAVLQENALPENNKKGAENKARKLLKKTNNSRTNYDTCPHPHRKKAKCNARGNATNPAIEIISQEMIREPTAPDTFTTSNDIVRIELSFVDKPNEKGSDVAPPARVYICDVCHKNFPVAGRFLAHFRRVHLKSFYKKQAKCPYCPRYFTTIVGHSNMNRHVRLVHKKLGKQSAETISTPQRFSCKQCGEKFDDSIELYEHSKSHDENVTETPDGFNLRCDYCQLDCSTLEKFSQHMKESHLAHDSTIKPFKCRWCNIRARKIQGLYSHIRTKHNPFASHAALMRAPKRKSRLEKCQCETCGKWMSSPAALALHYKSHATTRLFSCTSCSANFKYQSSLLMHLDKHTIDRKYKCNECGESYRRSAELKAHMKIHGIGVDKLHKCSICTKHFRFKEHLTIHMWSHTREHPFECSLCTKAFTRKTKLEEHMKIVHK